MIKSDKNKVKVWCIARQVVLKLSSPDRVLAMGSVEATHEDRYRFFQAIPLR